MTRYDVAVVGAGISGLSLAHLCAGAGLNTCVLERSGHVGGALHSARFDEGFWLELGAHTCYNSYGGLLALMEPHGLLERLLGREKVPWMFWEGDRLATVLSRVRKAELARSLPRLLWTAKDGRSVEDYYGRVLGRENYRRAVGPMLSAVTSQEAGPFPAGMLFKKRERRKDVRRSFTLEGGLQTIADTFATHGGFAVQRDTGVTAIAPEGEGYVLHTGEGEPVEAGAVALAVPAAAAAALLREAAPNVADLLVQVRVHAVPTVGVVVPREAVGLDRVAGIVAPSEPFYSVVSRDVVPDERYRGFAFHFRPGTPEDERERHIAAVLGVPPGQWAHRAERTNVLPAPVVGHDRLVLELDRALAGRRLLVTGNYFGGLAIEDCVTRSAGEFERLQALL